MPPELCQSENGCFEVISGGGGGENRAPPAAVRAEGRAAGGAGYSESIRTFEPI